MFFENKIWIGDSNGEKVCICPAMANRHGLIAGATGTGKTITLKVLAESFSDAGVPVFLADVKGDLSGMCRPGVDSESMQERIVSFGLNQECNPPEALSQSLLHWDKSGFRYQAYPTVFWDVYAKMGIPLRTTISEMGPILLSRLMDLTETQSEVLTVVFKIADDQQLLLIDTKDLKAMLQYAAENSKELSLEYGSIPKQSITAIIRNIVALEAQGADQFFGEPALNIGDWFANSRDGRGVINVLDCRELMNSPEMYSTFLLWMMSELFEILPEAGDLAQPRMVFFFDEAHLLFKNISKALREKIEQVVKLIRSKGVGIYFITQNPSDIPDEVLAQLGNKIQHALRAYTPSEEKKVKAAAASFRSNPEFDTKEVMTTLGIGEALISVLDENGIPGIVKKCRILPPQSLMGPIPDEEKQQEVKLSNLYLRYQNAEDRDSAYEFLQRRTMQEQKEAEELRIAEEEAERKAKEEARLAKDREREEARAEKEREREIARAEKEREQAEAKAEREREREAARIEKERAREEARLEREREREAEKREKAVKSTFNRAASTAAGTIGRELGNSLGKQIGGSFGKRLGGNIGSSLGRSILGNFLKL